MAAKKKAAKKKASGRAKGGEARAEVLTAEERAAIARSGAQARWAGPIKKATHGSPDHPLKIGDVEIPCYVLEDETRVLSQSGVIAALGMKYGSRPGGTDRLGSFLSGKTISPFVTADLLALIEKPIKFKHPGGGNLAYGFPATILADICDAVLAARTDGKLQKQQEHIAARAELLVRGFARVGIVALVDEATGYQRDRARDALAKILEAFIAHELQPYVTTFPAIYYEQMFRLRGLSFPAGTVKRPQYFGLLTNDIVYKRIAPGVLDELKRVKSESGRKGDKLFQRLTQNVGYPKLREHLGSVVTMMRLSKTWHDFMGKLDELHPRYGDTLALPFEQYRDEEDDGIGL